MEQMLFLVPVVGLLGLLFAVILRQQVVKEDPGTDKMREIADAIAEGANAFLASEYRILVVFVAVLFFVIGFGTRNWITAGCFLVGSGFSTMAAPTAVPLMLPVRPACTAHWPLHSPAEALWEWPW